MIGNGVQVKLPPSPRLERLRQQLEEVRRERDAAASAWGKFDVQRQRADSAAQRQALQAASDEAYAKQGAAERRINDLASELAAREHEIAHLVYERDQLSDELERSSANSVPVADFTITYGATSAATTRDHRRRIVGDHIPAGPFHRLRRNHGTGSGFGPTDKRFETVHYLAAELRSAAQRQSDFE